MRNLQLVFCTALIVVATAMAEETVKIHVDLTVIEDAQDLSPVNGLTSSGQPDEDQLALIAEAGYVAVIDLRGESENRGLDEANAVESLGLDYVNLPISGAAAISTENANKLQEILSSYDGPVLVHCGSGNRVGALLALSKSESGANDAEAIAYGRAAGMTGLEAVVRSRLAEEE